MSSQTIFSKNSLPDSRLYETPYRYGRPVLTGSGLPSSPDEPASFDSLGVDIPFVFYHQEQFYMLYTGFDGIGYQSGLAVSNDLLHWSKLGAILKREPERQGWDKIGAAGTWIIRKSNALDTLPKLQKIDGKYWMVYHSYPQEGYEAGPAQIGLAWCDSEDLMKWHRLPEPVFSWQDGAAWEAGGLYKACIIEECGTYYMFYNAKTTDERWIEQTGLATSADLFHWKRYPGNPVLPVSPSGKWDHKFVSDPFVVKDGRQWLNFFFGYDYQHAREGLAVSEDLLHWTKLPNPLLSNGEPGSLDETHAHKASVLKYQGRLYHFYCAVRPWHPGDPANMNGDSRTITVASDCPFDND
jgi:predicted GH43/DUF377 family glycosyl hydrolase